MPAVAAGQSSDSKFIDWPRSQSAGHDIRAKLGGALASVPSVAGGAGHAGRAKAG